MCNVYLLLFTVLDDVIADEMASDPGYTVLWGPRGIENLRRMTISFQAAVEHR